MTEPVWVISSCVLIAAVIAVRAIFGKKLSAGLRYALWGLVLLRLLIPGTVFSSPISVGSAVGSSQTVRDIEAVREISYISLGEDGAVIGELKRPTVFIPSAASASVNDASEADALQVGSSQAGNTAPSTTVVLSEATPERFERMQKTLELRDIANIIWYTGMALAAVYFIAANLRFYLKLRARRQKLDIDAGCHVYSVEGLNSSCLFLNTIYISKENAEDEQKLACVLAHEKAHRRHGDGLFALLRSCALVLHWYNPLVWAAAFLSRRDSELFADAGAIKTLGEDEREDYGRTLIELSSRQSVYAPIACAATMMTSGKRELKSRIIHIAQHHRMGVAVAAVVMSIALVAVGFTFLGGQSSAEGLKQAYSPEQTQAPSAAAEAPAEAGNYPAVATDHPAGATNHPAEFPLLPIKNPNASVSSPTLTELTWQLDIDGDGSADFITLDIEEFDREGRVQPMLRLADGTELALPLISTSHAGWGTYGITELGGREYVLYYQPTWYNGACEDAYSLYSVANGRLKAFRSGGVEFEVSAVRPLPAVDVDEVLAYVDEVNGIWQHSRLIFSTDTGIALKQLCTVTSSGLTRASTDEGYESMLFTVPEGTERYICYEQLGRMDLEFGFDKLDQELTPAEKLSRANEIMTGTAETSSPETGEDQYAFWPTGIERETDAGMLYLNLTELDEQGETTPFIELRDGTRLTLPYSISTSHAGMGTYATVNLKGKSYLLYYRGAWYGGMTGDTYCLMYVEKGQLKVFAENSIEYNLFSVHPLQLLDKEKLLAFVDELNEIWDNTTFINFSTDYDITLRQLYDPMTGKPLTFTDMKPYVHSIFAQQYGKDAFTVPDLYGWYRCHEELQRFDRAFNYDKTPASAAERIDYANAVMAENNARYLAMNAVGVEDFNKTSVISSSCDNGVWSFIIKVTDCPVEDGTADMTVTVVNGVVTDVSRG